MSEEQVFRLEVRSLAQLVSRWVTLFLLYAVIIAVIKSHGGAWIGASLFFGLPLLALTWVLRVEFRAASKIRLMGDRVEFVSLSGSYVWSVSDVCVRRPWWLRRVAESGVILENAHDGTSVFVLAPRMEIEEIVTAFASHRT